MLKILKSRRRNSTMTAAAAVSVFFFLTLLLFSLSFFISPQSLSFQNPRPSPLKLSTTTVAAEHHRISKHHHHHRIIDSKSVLFPEWIVFNIIHNSSQSPDDSVDRGYRCVFQNNATSPAEYAGTLSGNRRSYKCLMPSSVRSFRQFLTPALTNSELVNAAELKWTTRSQLPMWNWLVYDSLSTASDVVVFAKNVNRINHVRDPTTLRCVFTHVSTSIQVRTQVTSSEQEIFRCTHPPSSNLLEGSRISLTLEVIKEEQSVQIPSIATYETTSFNQRSYKTTSFNQRSGSNATSLCACTMVHNVGKFLKEWVIYHSSIGVEKFIFYDNDSDDGTAKTYIPELIDLGYNIHTTFWPWPKAQEAGFSHNVISSKASCKWMMFLDVDEFLFSPKWTNTTMPSKDMLQTLLNETGRRSKKIGQVMIQCHDFGPSNQTIHPNNGVTQGYTCRRKFEERHKSIVRLDAIDESLQNSVHHFKLKSDQKNQKMSLEKGVVNHYKYQAWPEFKIKFKRRVSTYVVDWTENINLNSKDRTPGLGVEAVEPQGWAMKFCEVVDMRLQLLTRKWFGRKVNSQSSVKMAWER